MKVHISLNVTNVEDSVLFYSRMFDAKPVKAYAAGVTGHGYAKFDIADPPLNLTLNERNVEKGGSLSHLGLQVESTDKVMEFKNRWETAGLKTADEMDVTCCYAKQDKTWIADPDGNEWEAFVVLENVDPAEVVESSCCNTGLDETTAVDLYQIKLDAEPVLADAGAKASSCC